MADYKYRKVFRLRISTKSGVGRIHAYSIFDSIFDSVRVGRSLEVSFHCGCHCWP